MRHGASQVDLRVACARPRPVSRSAAPVTGYFKVWSTVVARVTLPAPVRVGLSRAGRFTAQGLVLTALVGGTVAYTHYNKQVVLVVDGRSQSVSDMVTTVGDLLDSQGIALGAHDAVTPSASTELDDGDTVTVKYGRQLSVTVDGDESTFWTTETTVDRALTALGIRSEGASLSVSRSQPIGRQGLEVSVSTPKQIRVTADKRTRTLTTTAATVEEALADHDITLDSDDRSSVVLGSAPVDGMAVVVTRITKKTVSVTETYTVATVKKRTSSLYQGTTKTTRTGHAGRRVATYVVTYSDGKVVSRKLKGTVTTRKAVATVLQVGTKKRPTKTYDSDVGGSVDSLNWAALAQCESGGNPKAVNPSGYYGLYQFSLSTWGSVGGSGNPINASSAEQTMRAKMLYKRAGAGQWTCGYKLFT